MAATIVTVVPAATVDTADATGKPKNTSLLFMC